MQIKKDRYLKMCWWNDETENKTWNNKEFFKNKKIHVNKQWKKLEDGATGFGSLKSTH